MNFCRVAPSPSMRLRILVLRIYRKALQPVFLTRITMTLFSVGVTILLGFAAWYIARTVCEGSVDAASMSLRGETLFRVKSQFSHFLQRNRDATLSYSSALSTAFGQHLKNVTSTEGVKELIASVAWEFSKGVSSFATGVSYLSLNTATYFENSVFTYSTAAALPETRVSENSVVWRQTVDNVTGEPIGPKEAIQKYVDGEVKGFNEFVTESLKGFYWMLFAVKGDTYSSFTVGYPVKADGVVAFVSIGAYSDVVSHFLGTTGLEGTVMFVTMESGALVATSTSTDLLVPDGNVVRVVNATEALDVRVRRTAEILEETFGLDLLVVQNVSMNGVDVGGVKSYISSMPFMFDNLRMYLAIVVPMKTIMSPIMRQLRKMIITFACIAVALIVLGIFVVSLITLRMAYLLRPKEEVLRQKEATERALAAAEVKGQFLANISHDLRTPMAGIMGLLEIILCDNVSNEHRWYLHQMIICCKMLLRLLNNLLDFAKLEAGKMQLELLEFDIVNELEAMIDVLSVEGLANNNEIVLVLSEDMERTIKGDPSRVRQIFSGLIHNSCKFTTNGNIIVRGWMGGGGGNDASEPAVHPDNIPAPETGSSQRRDRVQLLFEVDDTGCGISPEKRRNLFNSFEQKHAKKDTHKCDHDGGTGLGLGIVKSLVKLMGGSIRLVDKDGPGSCFQFDLVLGRVSRQPNPSLDLIEFSPATSFSISRLNPSSGIITLTAPENVSRTNAAETVNQQILPGPEEKLHPASNISSPFGQILLVMREGSCNASIASDWFHASGCPDVRHVASRADLDALVQDSKQEAKNRSMLEGGGEREGGGLGEENGFREKQIRLALLDVSLYQDSTEVTRDGRKMTVARLTGAGYRVVWLVEQNTPSAQSGILRESGAAHVMAKPLHRSRLSKAVSLLCPPECRISPGNAEMDMTTLTEATASGGCSRDACMDFASENVTSLEGKFVLVAEDNDILKKIARITMEKLGSRVETVSNGREALERVRAQHEAVRDATSHAMEGGQPPDRFAVILMDCQMPVMDGYEGASAIRQMEEELGVYTPIVALTANKTDEDKKRCLAAGMDAYLSKPIRAPVMEETILGLLRKRR